MSAPRDSLDTLLVHDTNERTNERTGRVRARGIKVEIWQCGVKGENLKERLTKRRVARAKESPRSTERSYTRL